MSASPEAPAATMLHPTRTIAVKIIFTVILSPTSICHQFDHYEQVAIQGKFKPIISFVYTL
jgi:hypothetical protein